MFHDNPRFSDLTKSYLAACLSLLSVSVPKLLLIRKDGPALKNFGFYRAGLAASENSASINMRSRPKLRIC